MANEYGTVPTLKARLGIPSTDTADDTILTAVLEAVSRWVDYHCGRRFYKATETRYYTAEFPDLLIVDDLTAVSASGLKTDEDGDRVYERTWATTDFDLEPYNAQKESQPRPYTRIRVTPKGLYSFPTGLTKSVELAADFGYVTGASTAAPGLIIEGTLIQSARIFKRKEAIFGIVGSAELGQLMVVPRLDPDVRLLLGPFVRQRVGATGEVGTR